MTRDGMDFEAMVPDVLRGLMISALGEAARHGLAGDHHFYITYDTRHAGVVMPESLRARYPETMTIVLQHEFWDLDVGDEGFSVSLAFSGVPRKLVVPYGAVIGFADPSINFAVQFNAPQAGREAAAAPLPPDETIAEAEADKPGEVVTLDVFRKK